MSPNNYSFLDKPILGWLYCNKGKILYVNNSDQTVVALKSVIFFQQEHNTLNTNVKKLLKEHFNSLNINSTIFYWSPLLFYLFSAKVYVDACGCVLRMVSLRISSRAVLCDPRASGSKVERLYKTTK